MSSLGMFKVGDRVRLNPDNPDLPDVVRRLVLDKGAIGVIQHEAPGLDWYVVFDVGFANSFWEDELIGMES